ncbi:MAG TPA: IS110 family transposase [Fimbriimonadaceae bacterium]|jgi:transposase
MKSLTQTLTATAAIDLGATFHMAALNPDLSEAPIREFGVDTGSLRAMAAWLLEHKVEQVAIEATGVYWMLVYEVLENFGLRVMLVDGRKSMSLPGRTKTDVLDAAWLEKLLRHGMLSAAFVPDADLIALRTYRRLRGQYVEKASAEIQRMQKALQQMNVRLDRAVTDVTGVTGMAVIRSIVSGERDPRKLASFRKHGVKKSEQEIALALDGHFQDHYVFALGIALSEYEHLMDRLRQIDEKIEAELARLAAKNAPKEDHGISKPRSRRKNQPFFDLRSYLTSLVGSPVLNIPGFDASTVLTIIGECGLDMSRWPTENHFVSWLGLCPMHRITGGKVKRSKSKRVRNDAATAFRLAAQSLSRSSSALGCMLGRLSRRRGMPKAITAIARILAILYYRAVRYQKSYEDIGKEAYEERNREQTLRRISKTAEKLGFQLIPLNLNAA